MHITRECLKPIGPIDTNSLPPFNYVLSAVKAHTTTHCLFDREHHCASQLLRPVMHNATISVSYTNNMLYTVLFISI